MTSERHPRLAAGGSIVPGDRGQGRSSYTLLTPANRYISRLPSLPGARYYKLVTPRLVPSRIGMYHIIAGEEKIVSAIDPGYERFLLVMGGKVTVGMADATIDLGDGGFAYLGPGQSFSLEVEPSASIIAIKRRYEPWPGLAEPGPVHGHMGDLEAMPTPVDGLNRRELLDPADPAFDFNISHLEFGPGVALSQIEIHDEEHGLYMTSGGGLYHLDGEEHEVRSDDFIYMAPYCPQGFRAGPDGGSYLLYKDVYRDGF